MTKNISALSLKILFSYVLILTLTHITLGQSAGATTASITGRVVDPQGSVLPNVAITAKNLQTNYSREVKTTDTGDYIISQLPPGNYEIAVMAEGFANKTTQITLDLGTTSLFNVAMTIGGTSDIIEVVASSVVDEGKTSSSTNIDKQRIDDLPINRRNFLDFTLTSPRAAKDRTPNQGVVASSGISFNGQQARFNNVTVDGVDNNEVAAGSVRATFSQDAVQEFQVVSDSYSAEFGRAVGGVVNIVTRGGGNDLHGSLFFLNRNDSTSARDVFAPVRPEYKQYQFGATIGGPIKKDKIFYFGSFERLSVKQNNFVTISDASIRSARREGFALNSGPIPFSLASTSALARVDTRISNNDTLFVRYNYSGAYNGNFEPFGGLVGETAAGTQFLSENTLSVNNTYISPSLGLTNETRFLFNTRFQNILAPENGPRVQLIAPEGLLTFGRTTFLPQPRKEDIYQIIDNVSLTKGRHQIKFGGDFYYINLPGTGETKVPIFAGGFVVFAPIDFGVFGGPAFSGVETFDPTLRSPQQRAFLTQLAGQLPMIAPGFPSNLPLADLSLPTAYAQGFGNPIVDISQKEFSLFVQDDIKLKSNLLVKAGLRYDINKTGFMPTNGGNVSPRFGISYHPEKFTNLTFRGSYGIFFGVPIFGNATLVELTSATNAIKIPVIPFPFSILPFSLPGHKFPEGMQIPNGVQLIPQLSTVFQYDKNLRSNYSHQVTIALDYLLNKNTQLSASYNYVRGIKLLSVRNINPVVRPIPGDPLTSQLTGRVFPDKGQIFEFSSAYDTYYNSFTFSVDQKIGTRINLLAHYTFAKAIDDFIDIGTDIQETVNPLNIRAERGLSLQDVRNRLVVSGTFNFSESKNVLLRNFQLSTIVNLESGRPYNLLAGQDLNLSADNPAGDRPLVGGVSVGRNTGVLPGFANVDLRVTRTFTFKEKVRCQLIAEAFNLFNRVNISEVDRIFPPDAQGNFNLPRKQGGRFIAPRERFRNAFAPRQFQLGFRLSF